MSEMTASKRPDFLPKLIFSSKRLDVSTRPNGAIRLDWTSGISDTEELDPGEVARLIDKLTKWQAEFITPGGQA